MIWQIKKAGLETRLRMVNVASTRYLFQSVAGWDG
jgi:hypothetical protein